MNEKLLISCEERDERNLNGDALDETFAQFGGGLELMGKSGLQWATQQTSSGTGRQELRLPEYSLPEDQDEEDEDDDQEQANNISRRRNKTTRVPK